MMINHAGVIEPSVVGDRHHHVRKSIALTQLAKLIDRHAFDGCLDADVGRYRLAVDLKTLGAVPFSNPSRAAPANAVPGMWARIGMYSPNITR